MKLPLVPRDSIAGPHEVFDQEGLASLLSGTVEGMAQVDRTVVPRIKAPMLDVIPGIEAGVNAAAKDGPFLVPALLTVGANDGSHGVLERARPGWRGGIGSWRSLPTPQPIRPPRDSETPCAPQETPATAAVFNAAPPPLRPVASGPGESKCRRGGPSAASARADHTDGQFEPTAYRRGGRRECAERIQTQPHPPPG